MTVRDSLALPVRVFKEKFKVKFQPMDRWAIIGKTGSGKTQFTVTLVTLICRLVNAALKEDETPWSVWFIDTKGVAEDIARLREWGYVRVKALKNGKPDGPELYRYFRVEPHDDNAENCAAEVAIICRAAYRSGGNVIVVVDEFVQAIYSSRRMGRPLQDLAQRGRGRRVGFMGETQEPVDIPRQLVSQATHVVLFDVSYQRDIDWILQFFPQYILPSKMGYPHGFWYRHVDNTVQRWIFFKHEREFYDWVKSSGVKVDDKAA
jgi:energy-coupling factor transporter ATP-binding protein EcfA2